MYLPDTNINKGSGSVGCHIDVVQVIHWNAFAPYKCKQKASSSSKQFYIDDQVIYQYLKAQISINILEKKRKIKKKKYVG